jgi:hypothetical protein
MISAAASGPEMLRFGFTYVVPTGALVVILFSWIMIVQKKIRLMPERHVGYIHLRSIAVGILVSCLPISEGLRILMVSHSFLLLKSLAGALVTVAVYLIACEAAGQLLPRTWPERRKRSKASRFAVVCLAILAGSLAWQVVEVDQAFAEQATRLEASEAVSAKLIAGQPPEIPDVLASIKKPPPPIAK